MLKILISVVLLGIVPVVSSYLFFAFANWDIAFMSEMGAWEIGERLGMLFGLGFFTFVFFIPMLYLDIAINKIINTKIEKWKVEAALKPVTEKDISKLQKQLAAERALRTTYEEHFEPVVNSLKKNTYEYSYAYKRAEEALQKVNAARIRYLND